MWPNYDKVCMHAVGFEHGLDDHNFLFQKSIGKDANDGEKRTKMILILERRKEIGKKRKENSNLKNKNKGKSREMDS